jgi:hypothetical protein
MLRLILISKFDGAGVVSNSRGVWGLFKLDLFIRLNLEY